MEYKKSVSEPWFTLMKLGIKTCEGRLNKGDFSKMKKNDFIMFENNDFGFMRTFRCRITSIHRYDTFAKYLETETLEKCLPGIDTLVNGLKIYYKYYSPKNEADYKINAIRIKVCKSIANCSAV
jgi:ASC-1-like (ASCH) protein